MDDFKKLRDKILKQAKKEGGFRGFTRDDRFDGIDVKSIVGMTMVMTFDKIFVELEKRPKELGLEKLAKKHPEFVRYIAMNYKDFQELKKKWS